MTLTFDGVEVPIRMRRSGKGQISFRFQRNSAVLEITTPDGKLDKKTIEFLQEKRHLILKHYHKRTPIEGKRKKFLKRIEEDFVLYKGTEIPINWLADKKRWAKVDEEGFNIALSPRDQSYHKLDIVLGALRAIAKNEIVQRTQELGKFTGSQFGTIRVKNVKSKWGSCSNLKNLNFNWHMIFIPEELQDYLIIHELMHLREMNHSPAYWKWVERFYPNYREADAALRDYEWLIGIFDD
ncbi:MAG: M48 family metallopeptidase [Bacteroidota bacterium]